MMESGYFNNGDFLTSRGEFAVCLEMGIPGGPESKSMAPK